MYELEFVTLIKEYQRIIHKVCHLYRDNKEDREDLFQEITFQLWKAYSSFRSQSKVSTWIYRIALNTAIATFRKKGPDIQYVPVLPDNQAEQEKEGHSIQHELLFAALKQLDDSEKALITLYLEDFSYQQIAEIVGISENNIGVKLSRIRNKIQKLLIK
ncbi:RNA polymerase ECF-type sigma factor [Arcticibacter svalbardensis MN12-7]|uniref:RNA polymerase ECF-type sigma factor n=1 Tax=Arcticibacter svalbardensis MN12-7 TaxID=1150600 RepID=R9GLJ9_9SPHI|nr:sigma-70 family RNA polymerase sigma factor [Arcticibacter svalbardensis]EOR92692.1 RNA polymerase ECF-type sigma factor [Arcticibacter svalbardensis MN12-7]